MLQKIQGQFIFLTVQLLNNRLFPPPSFILFLPAVDWFSTMACCCVACSVSVCVVCSQKPVRVQLLWSMWLTEHQAAHTLTVIMYVFSGDTLTEHRVNIKAVPAPRLSWPQEQSWGWERLGVGGLKLNFFGSHAWKILAEAWIIFIKNIYGPLHTQNPLVFFACLPIAGWVQLQEQLWHC